MRYGDVTVERDLAMPAADGTVLRADLWRPAGVRGPLPTLLSRQPYGKAQAQSLTYRQPAWYARAGYAVVIQDVRGRWASDGEFEPYAHEAADGARAVAWAADQPWSDGRVGMWGFSYAGATQLQAAAERPAGLRAIAPALTGDDFAEGWTFRGGALELAFVVPWAAFLAADTARRRGDAAAHARLLAWDAHPGPLCERLPLGDAPELRAHAPWLARWLAAEDADDPLWAAVRVADRRERIDVPALHLGGWFDSFLEGTLRNHAAMAGADQRLVVGPWGHIPWGRALGAWSFGAAAGPGVVDQAQLAFFDRHLRDSGDGPDDWLLAMRGADGEALDAWPPVARPQTLYLRSGGAANTADGDGALALEPPARAEPCDVFVADPAAAVPSAGGHSCCFADHAPIGPAVQTEIEGLTQVLCYTSPPLATSTLLAGAVELALHGQTDTPDGDWTAKLCVVDAAGVSMNVLEGVARLRAVVPAGTAVAGEVLELRVALGATCLRLAPGERLRLQVAASDFPRFDRNLQTGAPLGEGTLAGARVATRAVHHEPGALSHLVVPVVEGGWT
jgi:putative CocE/NonD family hydrolase